MLDDVSESLIPAPMLWSTHSEKLKAPGKDEDLALAVNPS